MITATERIESVENYLDVMSSQIDNILYGTDIDQIKKDMHNSITFLKTQMVLLKTGVEVVGTDLKPLQQLLFNLEKMILFLDKKPESVKAAGMKQWNITLLEKRLSFAKRWQDIVGERDK